MVCLLQAVSVPDPSREFVCFYCCLIQAVPLSVELVGHSVCLHKCACVCSQLLCERYVWVVGVRTHDIFR